MLKVVKNDWINLPPLENNQSHQAYLNIGIQ